MELDDVADELYEVPPEEFVALRTQRRDEARAEGDKALAKEIGALPKPSTPAWVCNLLVRAHRDEIEGLVELGNLLREAQGNLAGDELKALDVQRRQLLNALSRQARAVAHQRGHPVSTAVGTQVEETLRAAMADPEAGEALLSGRLTSPMSYSGMGELTGRPKLRLVPPPASTPERAPATKNAAADDGSAERRRREQEERRRAAEEKRRRALAAAQEAADQATAASEEAEAALDEHRRAVEELAARRDELQARVEELADQLAEAEREAAGAVTALKREERRTASAERAVTEAAEARDRALARVAELSGPAAD
ncbi:hypothetical protein DQ237_03705 [Blastococcus sp. TF02-8]|uniref:hypothetical protein n=1 Tax=Blastococcus sp. TF02-8 TaxID=2250574 RepID=UPI000DEAE44E|nr:hypothetical protein [Blastococcus sp. TF02-8]RBY98011.1 hypothetical protein DQ237_03705 [Blastococcus sp. TF02-8]